LATQENVQRGLAANEARRMALVEFGGVTQVKEQYRTRRGVPFFELLSRDVRYGVRQLRRSPGFTVVAILTLGLGIGAVTSVFSVVDTVLLKPYAFLEPGRLVVVREVVEEMRNVEPEFPDNYRHFMNLRARTKTLEDAAIFHQTGLSVSVSGEHPSIVGEVVASPNLLHLLGVTPILGRDLVAADTEKGAPDVAVLSYAGWQTLFNLDPNVLGKTLHGGGTIVGVLGPEVRLPQFEVAKNLATQSRAAGAARETLIYVPMKPGEWDLTNDNGNYNYNVIGRLKPGVAIERARAELDALQHAYALSAHMKVHLGAVVTPMASDLTEGIGKALWLLFAAVGAVLLIACVNLANLQLARAVTAERETAVRAALGASRGRLMMARLVECLILALAGGAAGVALTFAGVRLLVAMAPANIARLDEVRVNVPVLAFAASLSMLAALVFGILPALRSLGIDPGAALQSRSSRVTGARDGMRTRNLVVAGEVACTVVLLLLTALVLRSFSHVLGQNRGFDSGLVTMAQVDLFAPQYGDSLPNNQAAKLAFADRAIEALEQLPGVQAAAMTSALPLTGETWIDPLMRPDHPLPEGEMPMINVRWVSQKFLTVTHMPLIEGRDFSAADRANPFVALISEKAARDGFPGEDPLGKKIGGIVPGGDHPLAVIGVVADARINGLKETAAMVYVPNWAFTPWTPAFLVRSTGPSVALIGEMRKALWKIDPLVAIPTIKTMDAQVSESVATDRFQAVLLSGFGASALLLALLGVYGVMGCSVSLREREFGIRIALGSSKPALMGLVVRRAAVPVLLGTGAGLAIAIVALRWVRSLLYETPVMDPVAIGGSLMLLLLAAAVAAVLPARRAASADPMKTLRIE